MVKLLSLLLFSEGASAVEQDRRWRDYLATLTGLPGLVRIVHNAVAPTEVRAAPESRLVGWQAVTESWFDDRRGADAAMTRLRADHAGGRHEPFVRILTHLPVDERLLHDAGVRPLGVKIIVFFKRRPDLARPAAQAYWQGPHARLGMETHNATEFLKRYFQNHVPEDYRNPDAGYDYDGAPEFWLESAATLASVSADSDVMKAIAEDEKNFADRTSIETLLVQESEIYARDAASSGWVAC